MAVNELRYVIKVDDQGTFIIEDLKVNTKDAAVAFKELTAAILESNTAEKANIGELEKLRATLIRTRDTTSLTQKQFAEFNQQINKVSNRIGEFTSKATSLNKVNADMQSSAGLAGAATIELGRVFSDIGYGVRGVANNVQQLASLFITLSVSAGGAGKAMLLVLRQLRGPLGILVAFQALVSLIEYLDREFDIFASTTKKLAKAFDEMVKSTNENIVRLNSYISVLENATAAEGARANALKGIRDIIPSVFDAEGKLKVSTEELTLAVTEYSKQQRIRAKIDALIAANADKIDKAAKRRRIIALLDEAKSSEEMKKIFEENLSYFEGFALTMGATLEEARGKGAVTRFFFGIEPDEMASTLRRQSEVLFSEMENIQEEIDELSLQLDGDVDDEQEKKIIERLKQLRDRARKGDIRELEKYISTRLKLMQELFEQEAKNELDAKMRSLAVRRDNEILAISDILDVEKYNELKEKIELKYENLRQKALEDHHDKLLKERDKYQKKLLDRLDKLNDEYFKKQTAANSKELKNRQQIQQDAIPNIRDLLEKQNEEVKKLASQYRQVADNVVDILYGGINERREMEISQLEARTQVLLANEELTQQQRVRILEDAEERKRKINEASIKEELKMTKIKVGLQAIELSANIIQTTGVFANENVKAAIKAAGTLNPAVIAGWAVTAAALAAQYVAAKKKSEAALARLNAQASGYGSRLGTGAGVQVQAPDFNVVGQSQASQLSETIAGAFGEPVKAYVVSTEIADSLAFQRQIDRQSGFGS